MELTVQQISDFMENWAPLSYAEDYDNVGLLVGHPEQKVRSIMVCVWMPVKRLLRRLWRRKWICC